MTAALDSNVATVTITVNAVNDAPVAADDAYSVDEDHTLNIGPLPGVLANDTDIDSATLTTVLASGPSNGILTLNADGSFSYTPNTDFNGTDSFSYLANDGSLDSNTATVNINVNSVNDAPVVVGPLPMFTLVEDEILDGLATILFSDVDISDVHEVSVTFKETTNTSSLPFGELTASVVQDTTASGTGGVVVLHYSVLDNDDLQLLGSGD